MNHNFTKIIFTLGPATMDRKVLSEMMEHGVDLCRLNMAHATHSWTQNAISLVREASKEKGGEIPFMMDVKGPEIRTGDIPETWQLDKDSLLNLCTDPHCDNLSEDGIRQVSVNYPNFIEDISAGQTILIDSGLLKMKVIEIKCTTAKCKILTSGKLGNRRHVNLPGVKVKLPSLTEKDKKDVLFGISQGIEFFALSFVREATDLEELKRFLTDNQSSAKIIAKIEDQSAVSNLEAIITAADGLMIARGDLGIEIPYETLPVVQRKAARICLDQGKPFIVATHLLESMIQNPMPTRAEITDISNAIQEHADCIMLSGETTIGKYPVECIDVMRRVSKSIETSFHVNYKHNDRVTLLNPKAKLLRSAVVLADELGGASIMAFTRSGALARILASLRPTACPIFAFTDVPLTYKHSHILWGVKPLLMKFSPKPEVTIDRAFTMLKKLNKTKPGNDMVIVTSLINEGHDVYTLQYRTVP